jgi:hypothetical protein
MIAGVSKQTDLPAIFDDLDCTTAREEYFVEYGPNPCPAFT